jgi:hypothetical protein
MRMLNSLGAVTGAARASLGAFDELASNGATQGRLLALCPPFTCTAQACDTSRVPRGLRLLIRTDGQVQDRLLHFRN